MKLLICENCVWFTLGCITMHDFKYNLLCHILSVYAFEASFMSAELVERAQPLTQLFLKFL